MKIKKPDIKFRFLAPKQTDASYIALAEAKFYFDKGDKEKAWSIFQKLNNQITL